MIDIYLVINDIIGYPGGGEMEEIHIKKNTVLYMDDDTTFDENSMEFKILGTNKFVVLNRETRYHGLPKNLIKYSRYDI